MANGSILVVDDDVDISTNVRDILVEFGYRADMAHDGMSALKLVEKNLYDVALLDYQMPDMDGATLYQRIKSIQPSLVAIMVTAHAGSDGVQRAKDLGTWHVLRKPVNLQLLLELIDKAANQPIVLLIDDDDSFCASIWELLRARDYRVSIAHDESEAKEKLSAERYDIVLLDLLLGPNNSDGVFEMLRQLSPSPASVIITGDRSHEELAEDMVRRGAKSLRYKPLDVGALLHEIESLTKPDHTPGSSES